jgi:hypothetical protein
MIYKKKITVLLTLIGALALVYVLTVFFEPERVGSRAEAFTWLEPRLKDQIDRITIGSAGEKKELVRKSGKWFVSYNGQDYPARQLRVEDFIGALTLCAPYPVQSSSPSSHERLGLAETSASRITVNGGPGLPLLDLLVGQGGATGQDVFLRKQGQNEVRSGEDKFTAYISSPRNSWYNLRLFPESEDGKLDVDAVQRLTVYDASATPRILTRSGREWTFSGFSVTDADMGKVDAYIRALLNTEGDDFDDTVNSSDPRFEDSRIVLELGNGEIRTIRLGPSDESGRRLALVSGSSHVYSIPGWAAGRLFTAGFEKDAD